MEAGKPRARVLDWGHQNGMVRPFRVQSFFGGDTTPSVSVQNNDGYQKWTALANHRDLLEQPIMGEVCFHDVRIDFLPEDRTIISLRRPRMKMRPSAISATSPVESQPVRSSARAVAPPSFQ